MAALLDIVKKGSVDRAVTLRIIDSTDGTPETGVVFNTSGIDLWYRRESAAKTSITEATLAALTTAHSDGGFLHIGDGEYRLDLPDAAVATGANHCDVGGTVTGMVVIGGRIRLVDYDPEDTVRLGLTALPNAAAAASGGLFVRGTGAGAINQDANGRIDVNAVAFGGTAGTFASGIPQASLTTSAINSVADQVWDEAASGHVAAGSYGARLAIIRSATAQAGAATTITLDASASAVDDFYNNQQLFIVAGTGVGQGRIISDYVGATKVATVPTWVTNPSSDSVFVITPFGSIPGASAPTAGEVADAVWEEARTDHVTAGSFGQYFASVFRSATAQAGTASTITLDASASATNDLYNYSIISIVGGTGAGQSRQISDYVGSSKVATVGVNWTVNPSSDSVFLITPLGVDAATIAAIADAVWDEARSGHATAGTFGEYVLADATRLGGNATAASNAKNAFDGSTGYTFTGSVMPTVTTAVNLTNAPGAGDFTSTMKTSIGTAVAASAVASVTGNVGGNVVGSVASVTGNVGGNVTGTIGSLAAQAKADVNAEVLDVLNTDTFAEPGQENPPATTTLVKKIGYLYKMLRNKKTQTATTFSLFADDATTVDQKATVSDAAGTTTSGELGTGP